MYMRVITVSTLQSLKENQEKFTCIAAYDASFAQMISDAGVESILVGDSLGMVLQGHDSTIPVTITDMIYHTSCVKRSNPNSLIIADMPFMTYGSTSDALKNARLLMQAGAHVVKLEGSGWLCETIKQLNRCGIPSCIHMGLTPQSVNKFGGYKVQGRQPDEARTMIEDALMVQEAGAAMLLLECVPAPLASTITETLVIPVIGIGAGSDTDGQVLVLYDMLGITPRAPKFSKNFLLGSADIAAALRVYVAEVKGGIFPAPEHAFKK